MAKKAKKAKKKDTTRRGRKLGSRGPAPGTGGRPRKGQERKTLRARKPWKKLGISMRTWYRRRAEGDLPKRAL